MSKPKEVFLDGGKKFFLTMAFMIALVAGLCVYLIQIGIPETKTVIPVETVLPAEVVE
jgi:hypothetical protein